VIGLSARRVIAFAPPATLSCLPAGTVDDDAGASGGGLWRHRLRPRRRFEEADYFAKTIPAYRIPTPTAPGIAPVSVIGEVQVYRIRKGDTLMDLARYYSLGYNEIVEANPGIDPWVPPAGATVLLPTQWVLPCCTYRGVVVNIPEMRLFYMRPTSDGTTLVNTYPVGLGRDDWRTPEGKFVIQGKT
jgi:lipoprotein-anchoring transpeptidase ErfK/SrfK